MTGFIGALESSSKIVACGGAIFFFLFFFFLGVFGSELAGVTFEDRTVERPGSHRGRQIQGEAEAD